MRKQLATLAFTAALAAALTLFGCKEEKAKTPEAAALISTAGVGIFQFGKPVPSDSKEYDIKPDIYYYDGNEWHIFSVFQDKEKLMEIWVDNNEDWNTKFSPKNNIKRIEVLSNRLATAEGIRVGATVDDFFKAFPKAAIRYSEYTDEYNLWADDLPSLSASLSFEEGFLLPKDNQNLKPADFKLAKIKSITVMLNRTEQEAKAEETAGLAESGRIVIKTDKGETLQEKDSVYYLNDKPFTGKAIWDAPGGAEGHIEWEVKDGRFHGKYMESDYITGNYKNGKKDGEWIETEPTSTIKQYYKDGKKHGEWRYEDYDPDLQRVIKVKIEVWENDALISAREETPAAAETGFSFADFKIMKGRLGNIKVGMTAQEAEKHFNGLRKEKGEAGSFGYGGGSPAYLYYLGDELLFGFIPKMDTDTLLCIIAISSKLETENGLNPNSTVEELAKKYPGLKVTLDEMNDWESFTDRANDLNFVFATSGSAKIGEYPEDLSESSSVPKRLAIKANWIAIQ